VKENLKAEELLQNDTFEKILSIENDIEQVKEINRIREIAKPLGMLKNFNDILTMKKAAAKKKNKAPVVNKIEKLNQRIKDRK
jgi:hypothetical protein